MSVSWIGASVAVWSVSEYHLRTFVFLVSPEFTVAPWSRRVSESRFGWLVEATITIVFRGVSFGGVSSAWQLLWLSRPSDYLQNYMESSSRFAQGNEILKTAAIGPKQLYDVFTALDPLSLLSLSRRSGTFNGFSEFRGLLILAGKGCLLSLKYLSGVYFKNILHTTDICCWRRHQRTTKSECLHRRKSPLSDRFIPHLNGP